MPSPNRGWGWGLLDCFEGEQNCLPSSNVWHRDKWKGFSTKYDSLIEIIWIDSKQGSVMYLVCPLWIDTVKRNSIQMRIIAIIVILNVSCFVNSLVISYSSIFRKGIFLWILLDYCCFCICANFMYKDKKNCLNSFAGHIIAYNNLSDYRLHLQIKLT